MKTLPLTDKVTRQYQQQIAPRGSTLYYSLLYYTKPQRQAALFIDGWHQAMEAAIFGCRELSATKMKLQWWQQQVEKLYQQNADHPIAQVLQHYVVLFSLPPEPFLSMVTATEYYLDAAPFQTLKQYHDYLIASAAARDRLMLTVTHEALPDDTINSVSCALEQARQLLDCQHAIRYGYPFFPIEMLTPHHIDLETLLQGKITLPAITTFFNYQAVQLYETLSSLSSLPTLLEIRRHITSASLEKMIANSLNPLEKPVSLSPLYKLFIAWRQYRAAISRLNNGKNDHKNKTAP